MENPSQQPAWRPTRGSRPYTFRGSRGVARGARSAHIQLTIRPDRDILEGLKSEPLQTLDRPAHVAGEDIVLKGLEYIGSYNWTDSAEDEPTIFVPGSPRRWRDRPLPYSVPRDTGSVFIDQHGYRFPSYPLLPLFRAVDIVTEVNAGPEVEWMKMDFITDRNGLLKLYRWIADEGSKTNDLRIDMELVGERTVLLNRWEARTREQRSEKWWSYGFNFERESTDSVEGCEQSMGHHRIVKFDFDGLNVVLRSAVDAYLPTQDNTTSAATNGSKCARTADVDHLSGLLDELTVSSTLPSPSAKPNKDILRIVRRGAGSQIPQDALIELTTRSEKNFSNYSWADAYPKLFFSQTTHHFLAAHLDGYFSHIRKRTLDGPEAKSVEAGVQANFRRLRRVLQIIQDLAIEHGQRGRLSLVCQDGRMQVYERTTRESCLPEDVMRRFEF